MAAMVPLGDASRRPHGFAFVTLAIIAVNAWAFFLELSRGNAFVYHWAAVPLRIVHGQHTVTLLTSMFLHASWMHIVGNMVFLWAFGPAMEDVMGRFSYLAFYLLGGLVAMVTQVLGDPMSRIPTLGASGAIAAVMGAFIVTFPRDRIRTLVYIVIFIRITFIPAVFLIGFWFLMQVLDYGTVTEVRTGGVAYLAHIGGFLFGVVLGRLFVDERRLAFRGLYG